MPCMYHLQYLSLLKNFPISCLNLPCHLFQKMTLIYSLDFPLDDHGPTNPTPCMGYPSAGNS